MAIRELKLILIVPADSLALNVARTSAGIVLASKLNIFFNIPMAIDLNVEWYILSEDIISMA